MNTIIDTQRIRDPTAGDDLEWPEPAVGQVVGVAVGSNRRMSLCRWLVCLTNVANTYLSGGVADRNTALPQSEANGSAISLDLFSSNRVGVSRACRGPIMPQRPSIPRPTTIGVASAVFGIVLFRVTGFPAGPLIILVSAAVFLLTLPFAR